MNKDIYDESLDDSFDPENQALVDLLQRARFTPTSAYQAKLWQQLQNFQDQQTNRSYNMSLLPWPRFLRRSLILGLTAGISSVVVVVIVLGATLALSPTARAQVQKLVVRFVEIDSPEEFLAEQAQERQAVLEAREQAAAEGDQGEQDTENMRPPMPDPLEAPGVEQPLSAAGAANQPLPDDVTLPPGRSSLPDLPGLVSLEEAQNRTSLKIQIPTWLPDGYSLQGVMVPPTLPNVAELPQPPAGAPALAAPAMVTVHFSDSAGNLLLLSQMRPSQVADGTLPEVLLPVPKSKGSVQETTVKGQSAQYLELGPNRQLHWQASDGIMFDLSSASLDQDTLIKVAESIQ